MLPGQGTTNVAMTKSTEIILDIINYRELHQTPIMPYSKALTNMSTPCKEWDVLLRWNDLSWRMLDVQHKTMQGMGCPLRISSCVSKGRTMMG